MADNNNNPAVQNPVQAYNGKNGIPIFLARNANAATNAKTGPVEARMVQGCAENNAYMIPHPAVLLMTSTVPIAPLVALSYNVPKPTAGAKQAKNKKKSCR
jgi:hypothetical protein